MTLPTLSEAKSTANLVKRRFNMPNAAFGVDGKLFPLGSKPRFKKKPSDEEPKAQHFWNYKRGYCLNAMIVGDGKYFRDIEFDCGSANDAGIYNKSNFKVLLHNEYRSYLCLGDSAYELTKNLITPFSQKSCKQKDRESRKRRAFNRNHSAARSYMTENMSARLSMKFPVIHDLRYRLEFNHSAARSYMTENMFARLSMKFP